MQYNILVHVDESDKEFLETPESKNQIDTVIYRKIMELRQAHFDKQSRQTFSRGFRGVEK
jgi:transcriptional accessory protein Tex/SPT6